MKTTRYTHPNGDIYNITHEAIASGWLQGKLHATWSTLLGVFGEPHIIHEDDSGDGKVRAEWQFAINGTLVAIYDWKETRPLEDVRTWSIGGTEREAADNVRAVLEAAAAAGFRVEY